MTWLLTFRLSSNETTTWPLLNSLFQTEIFFSKDVEGCVEISVPCGNLFLIRSVSNSNVWSRDHNVQDLHCIDFISLGFPFFSVLLHFVLHVSILYISRKLHVCVLRVFFIYVFIQIRICKCVFLTGLRVWRQIDRQTNTAGCSGCRCASSSRCSTATVSTCSSSSSSSNIGDTFITASAKHTDGLKELSRSANK